MPKRRRSGKSAGGPVGDPAGFLAPRALRLGHDFDDEYDAVEGASPAYRARRPRRAAGVRRVRGRGRGRVWPPTWQVAYTGPASRRAFSLGKSDHHVGAALGAHAFG